MILCIVFLNIISGCTPHFNWRVSRNINDNFEAIFPNRIHQQQRQIEIAKQFLPVRIYFSKLDESIFAVNVVKFPPSLHHLQEKSLNFLIKHFAEQTNCLLLLSDTQLKLFAAKKDNMKLAVPNLAKKQSSLTRCQKLVFNKTNYVDQFTNNQIIFDKTYYGSYQHAESQQQTLWYVRFVSDKNYIYQLTALTQLKINHSKNAVSLFNETSLKFFQAFRNHISAT